MKKLLFVVAIAGLMTSCKSKDEKKAEDTTNTTTTTPTTTEPTTTVVTTDVPTFSDPEVQKFVNDYSAFIKEYKANMNDPNKMAELSKNMQDWSTRGQSVGMKLANNPEDAKKWSDWWLAVSKDLMPKQ